MDFTNEEIRKVLKQWLPADTTERVSLLLTASSFSALQNPYILTLYLTQHGSSLSKTENIPSVEFDKLLEKRIRDSLYEVIERVSCDQSQIEAAFQALLHQLWKVRPLGIPSFQVLEVLKSFRVCRNSETCR